MTPPIAQIGRKCGLVGGFWPSGPPPKCATCAIGERALVGSGESEGVEGGTADVAGGAGREMARCRFAVSVVDEV